MNPRRILTFFLVILLLALLSIYYPKITSNATTNAEYPLEYATLERVIDGDTIVYRIGNTSLHARLLGINTPEKKMPFSNEAANFLKQFENKTIVLQRDWEDMDKYKRKLRYIFYEGNFINKKILENGFANTYYLPGLRYESELKNAEALAKKQEIGIWTKSQETCAENNCITLNELDYTEEFFAIQNICNFDCDMNGWFVKDAGRNVFYLSNLNSGEQKTYLSKNNTNIWNNDGDRFFMFDKNGYLVLFYEYS